MTEALARHRRVARRAPRGRHRRRRLRRAGPSPASGSRSARSTPTASRPGTPGTDARASPARCSWPRRTSRSATTGSGSRSERVGAGRRLAPHRRRRAPRRRRSAVDRGPARARAGHRRRRASRPSAWSSGRRRSTPCVSAAVVGVGPRGTQQVVVVVETEASSHGPSSPSPAWPRRSARRWTPPSVAAVLVVRAAADRRPAQLEDRPDPRRRVGGAGAGGGAGAPVTRVLVTGASGMLGRAVAGTARRRRARRPHPAAQPVAVAGAQDVRGSVTDPGRRRARPCGTGRPSIHLAAKVTITGPLARVRGRQRRRHPSGCSTRRGRRASRGSCTSRRRRSRTPGRSLAGRGRRTRRPRARARALRADQGRRRAARARGATTPAACA